MSQNGDDQKSNEIDSPLTDYRRPAGDEVHTSFPIVGIGSSAGGLQALEEVFKNIPADCHMAFLVLQHFKAESESHLPDILKRSTQMKVCFAEDGMKLTPNQVFITPPGHSIIVSGKGIRLVP